MGEDCGEACCCAGSSPPPPPHFLPHVLPHARSIFKQVLITAGANLEDPGWSVAPLTPTLFPPLKSAPQLCLILPPTSLPPLTRISTNTPLFLACRSPSPAAAATARLLIIAGADVNSKSFGQSAEISHTETPLHAAAEVCAPNRHAADAAPCENEAESGAVLEFNEVLEHREIYGVCASLLCDGGYR